MLYLLLTIIAVGVLLCSEPGKKILSGGSIGLLVLGVILLLVIGGWLVIANFNELILTLTGIVFFVGAIVGIVYVLGLAEQKVAKVGGYLTDNKQIPWYKPSPSAVVFFIIFLVSVLSYFIFLYMIKNHLF